MKKTRLIGLVLIAIAAALLIFFFRGTTAARKSAQIAGGQLAADLQRLLKAPADSLWAQFEPLRQKTPYGTDELLEFIKGNLDRGAIAGGFVEMPMQALMDPTDTSYAAADAMGPMALTYPPKCKLPTIESQENYLKLMEETAAAGKPIDDIFYLHQDSPPYADWVIRAYISPYNDKVHLVGLSFGPFVALPAATEQMALSHFAEDAPQGQTLLSSGVALQLLNTDGATAKTIGDTTRKAIGQTVVLDKYSPGYCGWKINVWTRSRPNLAQLIVIAIIGLMGIGLVIR